MKKVAVFGKPGSGKSRLSRRLAEANGLPLVPLDSFHERLAAADTLIYIDLPYRVSYWLVTKRLLKGLFVRPEGWPDGSSVWQGTLASYRILRRCPRFWNEEMLERLQQIAAGKRLHVIRSLRDLDDFVSRHA